MAHDFLLTPDRIADKYFVLPKGFNEKFTKKFAAEIEELEAARESGMTILRHQEAEVVRQVADAIGLHDVAKQIGRASWRERVCQEGEISGVAVSITKTQ